MESLVYVYIVRILRGLVIRLANWCKLVYMAISNFLYLETRGSQVR